MDALSLTARRQRWLNFYQGDGRFLYTIQFDPNSCAPPSPWPAKVAERIEHAWGAYTRQRERIAWLRDDTLPALCVSTGTEIFAEAFGCPVYRPEDNMPCALPLISNAREVAHLRTPELSASSLAYLFDIADELRRRAGNEALLRIVDIQSPMDIAALIWEKSDFYAAMIETPDAVRELAYKVRELLTAFLDEWFARYGCAFIAHFPAYYMPQGITLSEDEVGVVNGELFLELFLPELETLSARYGGIGMHCCANSRHQWEHFLRIPNLRVLNICQPEAIVHEAYRFFAPYTAQMHGGFTDAPAWSWPERFPADARVIFEVPASSRDEALELADKLWEACGR